MISPRSSTANQDWIEIESLKGPIKLLLNKSSLRSNKICSECSFSRMRLAHLLLQWISPRLIIYRSNISLTPNLFRAQEISFALRVPLGPSKKNRDLLPHNLSFCKPITIKGMEFLLLWIGNFSWTDIRNVPSLGHFTLDLKMP